MEGFIYDWKEAYELLKMGNKINNILMQPSEYWKMDMDDEAIISYDCGYIMNNEMNKANLYYTANGRWRVVNE